MTQRIAESLLSQLSEFVAARMGLHFPRERWPDLERATAIAAREQGFPGTESCIRSLLAAPPGKHDLEILASHLTVGETYFFRNPETFEILEQQILPERISARRTLRRLRVWSAGCSTGEEAYSLAIVLRRLLGDLREWDLRVLATDINPRFLEKASAGVYSQWSFRQTPDGIQERYFQKTRDGKFAILPEIKRWVSFSYLNLAEDAYPALWNNTHAMDIIFCRNVLMYFHPERARKAVEGFERALVEGGWLIVSPAETSHLLFAPLTPVHFPGAILYRKEGDAQAQLSATGGPALPAPLEQERMPRVVHGEPAWVSQPGADAEPAEKPAAASPTSQDRRATALWARDLANQGKLVEALAWCEKALAADKLDPACHYLRAAILQEQGEVEGAAVSLRRALYLDPKFVLAHFALGNLLRRQGKFGLAQKHFENAGALLRASPPDQALPQSDGMSAAWLMGAVTGTVPREGRA